MITFFKRLVNGYYTRVTSPVRRAYDTGLFFLFELQCLEYITSLTTIVDYYERDKRGENRDDTERFYGVLQSIWTNRASPTRILYSLPIYRICPKYLSLLSLEARELVQGWYRAKHSVEYAQAVYDVSVALCQLNHTKDLDRRYALRWLNAFRELRRTELARYLGIPLKAALARAPSELETILTEVLTDISTNVRPLEVERLVRDLLSIIKPVGIRLRGAVATLTELGHKRAVEGDAFVVDNQLWVWDGASYSPMGPVAVGVDDVN